MIRVTGLASYSPAPWPLRERLREVAACMGAAKKTAADGHLLTRLNWNQTG
jgi:hypothetical protein